MNNKKPLFDFFDLAIVLILIASFIVVLTVFIQDKRLADNIGVFGIGSSENDLKIVEKNINTLEKILDEIDETIDEHKELDQNINNVFEQEYDSLFNNDDEYNDEYNDEYDDDLLKDYYEDEINEDIDKIDTYKEMKEDFENERKIIDTFKTKLIEFDTQVQNAKNFSIRNQIKFARNLQIDDLSEDIINQINKVNKKSLEAGLGNHLDYKKIEQYNIIVDDYMNKSYGFKNKIKNHKINQQLVDWIDSFDKLEDSNTKDLLIYNHNIINLKKMAMNEYYFLTTLKIVLLGIGIAIFIIKLIVKKKYKLFSSSFTLIIFNIVAVGASLLLRHYMLIFK